MANQTLLVLLGGLGLSLGLILAAAFLPKARRRARWTLRGLASLPVLSFAGLISGALPLGLLPCVVPYEDLGSFKTTDLQGRPCTIDAEVKYLSSSIPPGMLPRLRLVSHGAEGSDSLTYDTGWRFGVHPIRPVPGGIEVFTMHCGVRFSVTGRALKVEKERILATAPHDLYDLETKVDPRTYELMKVIGNVGGLHGGWFDPGALVRAVNALLRVGKDRAAEVIRAYYAQMIALSGGINVFNEAEVDRLLLILRLLFVTGESPEVFPPVQAGLPKDLEEIRDGGFPLYPLVVFKGLPFLVAPFQGRYHHDEPVEDPTRLLQFCLHHFVFRSAPMVPEGSPLEAFEELRKSPLWDRLKECDGESFYLREGGFRLQALMAMSVMEPTTAEEYNALTSDKAAEADKVWVERTGRLARLKPRWDSERQDFVPSGN